MVKRYTDKERVNYIIELAQWANQGSGRHIALECILSRRAIDAAIRASKEKR